MPRNKLQTAHKENISLEFLMGYFHELPEPRHEKICLRGFRPGKTRTGLLSYRDKLES